MSTSVTHDRIVEAAVKLFARLGFSATTTREVALLANVNEATIFRHFPTKQALFVVAMQSQLQMLHLGKELEAALERDEHPQRVVPLLIGFLVQTNAYRPDLIRLLRFAFLEMRPTAEQVYREHLAPTVGAVLAYFRRAVSRGVLHGFDPSITAVGFLTTVLCHQGMHELLLGVGSPFANTDQAVAAYSAFWVQALTPSTKLTSCSSASANLIACNLSDHIQG